MKNGSDEDMANTRTRLGIFLDNEGISSIDFSGVKQGNPGCGGTEYLYALIIAAFGFEMDIHLFSPLPMRGLENYCVHHVAHSLPDSFREFSKYGSGFFILNASGFFDIASLNTNEIIPVFWFHVDQEKSLLKGLNQYRPKHFNVFLTKDQVIRYSIYKNIISNAVIIPHPHAGMPLSKRDVNKADSHNVAFIGSLTPNKNVDLLTRAWPAVKKKVPDAKLLIIGSGKLYSEKTELGLQSLCRKDYEGIVIDPLLRCRCADSVCFLGTKSGAEIERDILPYVKVGVVNPAFVGVGETFCLSAIQFGHAAVPVVGGDLDGLRFTLPTKCGVRIKSTRHLSRALITLLLKKGTAEKLGKRYQSFVLDRFDPCLVFSMWERLFSGRAELQRATLPVLLVMRTKLFFKKCRLFLRRKVSKIKAFFWDASIKRMSEGV